MEILNVKDLDLIKGYFKQELHPRARDGKFAKKHSGIVSPVVKEEPKKAPKTGVKGKTKISAPKKDLKGKVAPKKTTGKKIEPVVKVPKAPDKKTAVKAPDKKTVVKAPVKKTSKTKESTAPKMPPVIDNPIKKRVPKLKLAPALQKPEVAGDITPDFQSHGRVRVVARRTGSYGVPSLKVNSYEDVASIFADLADADREKLYVLGTKAGEVIGIHCAHIGTINTSVADPKDMVKVPLLAGADTIYIIHNHPGGQSDPSGEDKQLTGKFSSVTDNMQIKFGGHVIIGDNNFSFLDRDGVIAGFKQEFDRNNINRSEQAPIYETYQEKDNTVPNHVMNGGDDVKRYIKDNLNILDANKSIYILGADNKNAITCAVPLDVSLPPSQLKKQAMEILVKSNSKNFFMFTGYDSADKLRDAGIRKASEGIGVNLYDAIVPNTSDRGSISNGFFSFRSYAEHGDMDLIRGLYIDLQKALAPGKVTKTQAKALHKELPPGGEWRTMGGHHIYILNGKVLAGAIPGVKSAKKATKAHLAEHQETIDKEAKAKKKSKPKPKAKTGKEAIEDALKKPNPKTKQATLEEQKKQAKEMLKKPNPKGKKATLEEQQKQAHEMLGTSPPVPSEAKRASTKTTKKKGVADIRTEKQANNELAYDVGTKIGGSRKDLAVIDAFVKSLSGQSLEELEGISPEQAQKFCVKKNLVKPVDFEAEHKRGTEINVAMTKQLLYDRVAPKPQDDTPEERAKYLHAIKNLQRQMEPIKTWDEFKGAVENLRDWMRNEEPDDINRYQRAVNTLTEALKRKPTDEEVTRGRYNTVQNARGKWEHKREEYKLTEAEWRAEQSNRLMRNQEALDLAKQANASPYSPLGEKLTNFFVKRDKYTDGSISNSTIATVEAKKLSWDTYFGKQVDTSEAPKTEKAPKREKWEKEMPAKITRSGGRDTKVKKPEEMVKTFGFKGIEFGNWVDDKSGNFHLVKCAEAFHDLADILGLQDKDVSMNGKLSMAFGARGKGKALAHYEPLSKAINITKEGGAGSLAHEWGHAMDNILYQESVGRNSTNLASEGIGDAGDKRIKASYEVLMDAILKGDGTGIDYVYNHNKDDMSYYPSRRRVVEAFGVEKAIVKYSKEIDDKRDRELEYVSRGYSEGKLKEKKIKSILRKHTTDKNAMVQEMAFHHKKLTGEVLDKIPVPNGMSQFYTDSKNVGGDTDYWISNCELFARAFETYVESRMRTGKIKNDYLVHGSWYDVKATPYPKGKERDAINGAFEELMKNVRSSGAIQKGLEISNLEADAQWEELQKAHGVNRYFSDQDLAKYEVPSTRSAYNVASTEGVLYIPLNRLQTPYQTEKASNFDKIRENVTRMENGENLEPIVIGFNYEVHDGHHKLEASKIRNYTHAPCIIEESPEDLKIVGEDAFRSGAEQEYKEALIRHLNSGGSLPKTTVAQFGDMFANSMIKKHGARVVDTEYNAQVEAGKKQVDKNMAEYRAQQAIVKAQEEADKKKQTQKKLVDLGIELNGLKAGVRPHSSLSAIGQAKTPKYEHDLRQDKLKAKIADVEKQMQDLQPSVHKSEKPVYDKGKGQAPKTKGVDAKMSKRLSATNAKKLMGEYEIPAGHREALLRTLEHSTTVNHFRPGEDGFEVQGSKEVVGREYSAVDVQKAVSNYKANKKFAKEIASKAVDINVAVKKDKQAKADAKVQAEREHEEFLGKIKANTDQMYKDQEAREARKNRTPEQIAKDEKAFAEFDPFELMVAGVPKEAPKVSQYYKSNKATIGGDDKLTYVPVDGKKVDIGTDVHAFIHKGAGGQGWVVTEARTGLMLESGKTQGEAVRKATEAVSKLRPGLLAESIKGHITRHGESPATGTPETMGKIFSKSEAVETPYHIAIPKGKSGKAKYMPVHEHAEKVHAFIHGSEGDWTVSEARSGLKIISNSSKNLAIKIAKELVERNRENLEYMVQKHIEKHGESPKTKK